VGFWGVRYQVISGQRCSAGNCFLYADDWFPSRYAKPAPLRPGFNWWPQVDLQRSRRFGIAVDPDGRQQESGGWNRVLLQVQDPPARIADLRKGGVRFRNEMEVGPGGKQIQIEDPDGNPIELFEPARR
jgi:catechol 2,3-dioxygenase-like lactoylglutathione lyase family enzyme